MQSVQETRKKEGVTEIEQGGKVEKQCFSADVERSGRLYMTKSGDG